MDKLGGFDSKAGSFVGKGMFGLGKAKSYSITNLGSITNVVEMSGGRHS